MTPYWASVPLSSHKCNCIMSSETGAFAQLFFFLDCWTGLRHSRMVLLMGKIVVEIVFKYNANDLSFSYNFPMPLSKKQLLCQHETLQHKGNDSCSTIMMISI